MLKDFKEFALKGNVMDLAVGLVIGAAFGKIVSSFVSDVLMPPLGLLLGKTDMTNLFINLTDKAYPTVAAAKAAGAATLNYGMFLNTIVDFLIVAFVIFLVVHYMNKMRKEEPADPAVPTTKECAFCNTEIPIPARRCPNCTSSLEKIGPVFGD